MKPIVILFLLLSSLAAVSAEGSITWAPGASLQSEYKELAGSLSLGTYSSPVVKSEGRDYLLLMLVSPEEIPQFRHKTPVIMKGIAATVALPGQPTQYLFWPMECTIKGKRYVFPDPSALHWQWLMGLGAPLTQNDTDGL